MTFLIDTHILLWSLFESNKIRAPFRSALADPDTCVLVSPFTFWEISLKFGKGKLTLGKLSPNQVPASTRKLGFRILPISEEDLSGYHELPETGHKDPFDKMLVWQCLNRELPLMSQDRELESYRKHGLEMITFTPHIISDTLQFHFQANAIS